MKCYSTYTGNAKGKGALRRQTLNIYDTLLRCAPYVRDSRTDACAEYLSVKAYGKLYTLTGLLPLVIYKILGPSNGERKLILYDKF